MSRKRTTYATLDDLQAATMVKVRTEITERAGLATEPKRARAFLKEVRDSVQKQVEHQQRYHRERDDRRHDAEALIRSLAAHRSTTSTAFGEVRALLEEKLVRRLEQLFKDHYEHASALSSSRFFVADSLAMRGPKFWWKGEPTTRDRALVSLLIGNFPEVVRVRELSVGDVIQREARSINTLRSRQVARNRRRTIPTR